MAVGNQLQMEHRSNYCMTRELLYSSIEKLHRLTRTGDFSRADLLQRCWTDRRKLPSGELHALRLRTIAWEIYHSRGEYRKATECLQDGGEIEAGADKIIQQNRWPDRFIKKHFPDPRSAQERKSRKSHYDLWRQRVMGMLAMGADDFLLPDNKRQEMFGQAQKFLEECLGGAGFPCVGTRSRLHFFRGNSYEANYVHALAAAEYDQSLAFCIARADDRMQKSSGSSQFDAERAFAVYCLGKLELRFGWLDFHRGHLDSAKRHARRAGLLLRTSQDPYLPCLAQLLVCLIERYKDNFGWNLVTKMSECRESLTEHIPYRLQATIEVVKTSVYLREVKPPKDDPTFLSLDQALRVLAEVADEARKLGLKQTQFHALLVRARTLSRLKRFDEALQTVADAENLLGAQIPKPLEAEAWFVKGKICATRGRTVMRDSGNRPGKQADSRMLRDDRAAHDHFQKALNVGDASLTFEISCRLQMSEMLLRLDRIREAKNLLAEAKNQIQSVQHTFLQERLGRLERMIDETTISEFRYSLPLFSLDEARDEVERKFLLAIQRQTNLTLKEALKNFSKIKTLLGGVKYDRLRILVDKHSK
jgi:tetratricopeptide (TPR) repeat protein